MIETFQLRGLGTLTLDLIPVSLADLVSSISHYGGVQNLKPFLNLEYRILSQIVRNWKFDFQFRA